MKKNNEQKKIVIKLNIFNDFWYETIAVCTGY